MTATRSGAERRHQSRTVEVPQQEPRLSVDPDKDPRHQALGETGQTRKRARAKPGPFSERLMWEWLKLLSGRTALCRH